HPGAGVALAAPALAHARLTGLGGRAGRHHVGRHAGDAARQLERLSVGVTRIAAGAHPGGATAAPGARHHGATGARGWALARSVARRLAGLAAYHRPGVGDPDRGQLSRGGPVDRTTIARGGTAAVRRAAGVGRVGPARDRTQSARMEPPRELHLATRRLVAAR